jgi:hypothetical protein
LSVYRQLPWDQDGVICNDEHDCFIPVPLAELGGVEGLEEQLLETSGNKSTHRFTDIDKIIDADFPTGTDSKKRARKSN